MKFARPDILWLLLALPFVAVMLRYAVATTRRRTLKYLGAVGQHAVMDMPVSRQWGSTLCILTAMAVLVVALARPQWGYTWKRVPSLGKDIFIALDVSNSMLAQDVRPNRLEQAKREVLDILSANLSARVGLIVFAGSAFVYCPLTSDHDAVRMFLEDVDTSMVSRQGTALSQAIELATHRLKDVSPEESTGRSVIVITDGEDQDSKPEALVKTAVGEGISFAFIGIGTPEGAPIPEARGGFKKDGDGRVVVSKLGETSLRAMAEAAGGIYVRAEPGDADLAAILPLLKSEQKSGDTSESGERQQVWQEQYIWFVLLAFLLLWAERLNKINFKVIFFGETKKTMQHSLGFLIIWLMSTSTMHAVAVADTRSEAQDAYKRGDFAGAAAKYLELEVDEPSREHHTYNRAVSQFQAQQFDAAKHGFARAAQSRDPALASRSYFNLGNTEVARNDLNAAIAAYEKALELKPQDEAARDNLAWAKEQLKRQQQEASSGSGTDQDQKKTADSPNSPQAPNKDSSQASSQAEANKSPQDGSGRQQTSPQKSSDPKKNNESMASASGQPEPKTDGHDHQKPSDRADAAQGTKATDVPDINQQQAMRVLRQVKDAKHRRAQNQEQQQPATQDASEQAGRDW